MQIDLAKPRIPKKRAKAFSAYIERFWFVIVNKMGNWLSLKTFEIQHALYGSRLRLWWVPVTNTHLVSCWVKTNGVLVLLERKLVPVSNRTLPSSGPPHSHFAQDSWPGGEVPGHVPIVPCSQLARSYKHEIDSTRLLPVDYHLNNSSDSSGPCLLKVHKLNILVVLLATMAAATAPKSPSIMVFDGFQWWHGYASMHAN